MTGKARAVIDIYTIPCLSVTDGLPPHPDERLQGRVAHTHDGRGLRRRRDDVLVHDAIGEGVEAAAARLVE